MNPFRLGRNASSNKYYQRHPCRKRCQLTRNKKCLRTVKLRNSVGIVKVKTTLKTSLLNVDGYTEASYNDVNNTIIRTVPDITFILETKRRIEEHCIDVSIDGYNVLESRRSDLACDRNGGGILVYTRIAEGLVFKEHNPEIVNPAHSFVNNERKWVKIDSINSKTALCGVYMGFQSSTDKHGLWNDSIYEVLCSEISDLKKDGYRILMLGDFNGHVGREGVHGVNGNNPDVNLNGRRFFRFLDQNDCVHVNGDTNVTTGLWTRQRAGVSSVIDFGVISAEHLDTVKSMFIDDKCDYPSGSDHNWIFIDLVDKFVRKFS